MLKHRERRGYSELALGRKHGNSSRLLQDPLAHLNHRLLQWQIATFLLAGILFVVVLIVHWSTCPFIQPYEPIVDESSMPNEVQWGHGGDGVTVNPSNLSNKHEQELLTGLQRYGYNAFVSSRVSMRRSLPDTQSDLCRGLWTGLTLKASVVIVFHNEAWSTLMRTIFSVLDRSESYLLKEITIVDDASTDQDVTGVIVSNYLAMYPKVKVVQLLSRHGLWRARMQGARHISGDVIVFLHSKCECNHGWLRPLMGRLERSSKVIAVPVVDIIDPMTFEYKITESVQDIHVGTFTWDLKKTSRRTKDNYYDEETPIPSPVIKDGIFAITRSLLMLNTGDSLWQEDVSNGDILPAYIGDDIEESSLQDIGLSFGTWMCGGSIEIIPCSHVGLVEQKQLPARTPVPNDNSNLSGADAVAEVWMDEFKSHVHDRVKGKKSMRHIGLIFDKYGPIREGVKCHNFSWYLSNVESTLTIPPLDAQRGELIHTTSNRNCVLGRNGSKVHLFNRWRVKPVSIWYLTKASLLATEDNMCLAVTLDSRQILLRPCDVMETVYLMDAWTLTETGLLYHKRTQLCLTAKIVFKLLKMAPCDHKNKSQKWTLSL